MSAERQSLLPTASSGPSTETETNPIRRSRVARFGSWVKRIGLAPWVWLFNTWPAVKAHNWLCPTPPGKELVGLGEDVLNRFRFTLLECIFWLNLLSWVGYLIFGLGVALLAVIDPPTWLKGSVFGGIWLAGAVQRLVEAVDKEVVAHKKGVRLRAAITEDFKHASELALAAERAADQALLEPDRFLERSRSGTVMAATEHLDKAVGKLPEHYSFSRCYFWHRALTKNGRMAMHITEALQIFDTESARIRKQLALCRSVPLPKDVPVPLDSPKDPMSSADMRGKDDAISAIAQGESS